MTKAQLLTLVRTTIGHDTDTQVTDTQINTWIDQVYPEFRREILGVAPSLYTAVAATQVLTTTDADFDLPADFERVNRFEVLVGNDYLGVPVADSHSADFSTLSYREEAGVLRVAPSTSAAGTYKLTYNKAPSLTGDYLVEVPTGLELVIAERVAGHIRPRFNEGAEQHQAAADRIWHGVPGIPGSGQKTYIRRRYGGHTQSGLARTRGW